MLDQKQNPRPSFKATYTSFRPLNLKQGKLSYSSILKYCNKMWVPYYVFMTFAVIDPPWSVKARVWSDMFFSYSANTVSSLVGLRKITFLELMMNHLGETLLSLKR